MILRIMQLCHCVLERNNLVYLTLLHQIKHYSEQDLELLESVAFQIGSAIKRILLIDREKEAAKINERNRLARDLHDSVNQMLFSLKLTAHAAQEWHRMIFLKCI